MRKALIGIVVVFAALLLEPPQMRGAPKEIIQLQRDVALLQQQVRELQESVDKNNAILRTLLEQSLDAVNHMGSTISALEKSVQEAQAHTQTRVDTLATQVQSLRDTVDELRARLGQMSQQLAETRSVLQSVDARLAVPPVVEPPTGEEEAAGSPPPPSPERPPSAEVLYSTALRDFTSGKYDLARQQFADYLNYYGRTQLAGNARFYIGETYYHQNDYRQAIGEYDKVLDQYPNSYKIAAAYLKKGYALLELDEREAGVETLRALIEKFPRSQQAQWARARLERLRGTAQR